MAIIGNFFQIQKQLKNKGLDLVFNYLELSLSNDSVVSKRLKNYAVGSFERIELSQEVFALEQVFLTKSRETCFFESHMKYIDFQLMLEGEEQMEILHQKDAKISHPYDESQDLILYNHSNETSKILMKSGDLAIYFPNDIHMGLGWKNSSVLVRKTVVKLPVIGWNTW